MRKIMTLLTVIAMVLVITGCRKDNDNGNGNGPINGEIPYWQTEEITLRFATWQYTQPDMVTLDVLMVDAFMDKYPNITVEMQVVAEWYDWDTAFLGLLEANNLPDVFLVQRLESFLPFNILADMTEIFDADPDTAYIFDSVRDLGMYEDNRFAIPTFIYPNLWFVNLDLLDQAGITKPSYNWTIAQMENIAKATTNPTTNTIGVYGCMFYQQDIPKVLKIQQNETVGRQWYGFGYDGQRFNFDDPVMQQAVNLMDDAIQGGYCTQSLSPEQLEERYNDPTFIPTYGGRVAMWREFSWSAKDYFETFAFDWDAYPGPGGVTGGNTDIAGISSLSQHPEAAYELLKWLSFDEEGLLKRYEIFAEVGSELFQQGNNYPYPIVDYGIDGQGINRIWESIPYGNVAPGLVSPEFIEGLRNGAMWANKETIGWDAVDFAIYDYFAQIRAGENTYAALRDTIQATADQAMQASRQAMRDMLGY